MFWRHVVAAEAAVEEAGNSDYTQEHMGAIFREGFSFSGYERNFLALNQGPDLTYLDVSGVSGVDSISDGRGAIFADFDNDGDTDIFQVTLQRTAHYLYRNEIGQDAGFVRIELEGTASGRDAFGAEVRVKTSAGVLTKVKSGGSGFLAQHDPRLLFGLGADKAAEWVEVSWPSGNVQRLQHVTSGSSIRIVERTPGAAVVAETRFELADPLFADAALLATLELELGGSFPDLVLEPVGSDVSVVAAPPPRSLYELLAPGRRTLVNLWATWCIPCRAEMPELQILDPALERAGVDLIGVSIDTDTRTRVAPFLRSLGVGYPVYGTSDMRIPEIYKDARVSIPLSVLLDDEGRVLQVIGGWSASTAAQFRQLSAR